MNLKILVTALLLLNISIVKAHQVTIDLTKLENHTSLLIDDGDVLHRIPSSGILTMTIKNLPKIIAIRSIGKKGKVLTHQSIWLKGSSLQISGSINDQIVILPSENGEPLEEELYTKYDKIDLQKDPSFIPSQPFLVYVQNRLSFKEVAYIEEVLKRTPAADQDFWAAKKLKAYLMEMDAVGYDPANKQFPHLNGMNRDGVIEKFERPQDKFLLIDFSSSDCKPCLAEIDALVVLQNAYEKELELLTLWNDPQQEAWLSISKKQKAKINWISLRDDSQAIFKKFDIKVYPTYLLINPKGEVVKKWQGISTEKIKKFLDKNL